MTEGISQGAPIEKKKPEWSRFTVEADVDFAEGGGYLGGIVNSCELNPQLIGLYIQDIEVRLSEAREAIEKMGDPTNFHAARIINLEKLEKVLLNLIPEN